MKFPDVSQLGAFDIEGAGHFIVFMVKDDWSPAYEWEDEHSSDHARGGCECPCAWPDPLDELLAASAVKP